MNLIGNGGLSYEKDFYDFRNGGLDLLILY
jgi:hypothetical protein